MALSASQGFLERRADVGHAQGENGAESGRRELEVCRVHTAFRAATTSKRLACVSRVRVGFSRRPLAAISLSSSSTATTAAQGIEAKR